MLTEYHFDFDIAAIMIMLLVMICNSFRKEIKNSTYYIFWGILWATSISALADICSIRILGAKGSAVLFEIANSTFYLGKFLVVLLFLQYLLSKIYFRQKMGILVRAILIIPAVAYTLAVLSNPWLHLVYSYDQASGVYSRGSINTFIVSIAVIYFAVSCIVVLLNQSSYGKKRLPVVIVAIGINVCSMLIELVFPKVMFHSFGFALTILLIFIVVREPGATVDQKTGMPNVKYFSLYANRLLRSKTDFNITFIRIADYELFISTYGFEFARELIYEISMELLKYFNAEQTYSLGPNMFAIVVPDDKDVKMTQNQLKALLDREWQIKGIDLAFAYFIVTLNSPKDMKNMDDIMSYVTYIERMHRKRYGILDPSELELKDRIRENAVSTAIASGLENNHFKVYYQPIYSIKEGKFTTAEALIRLIDPELGFVSPGEFIPIAEQTGSIIQIGQFVTDSVFRLVSEADPSLGINYIELNLSTIECLQRNFMLNLYDIMEEYSVDPHQICFEITETAANCAPEIFDKNLRRLTKGGFRLAIDDFGTGYSNLSRLVSTTFTIVKFDNTTIANACASEELFEPFTKLIQLIHNMNAKVVAEGVETKEQYDFIAAADVDYIQGYYFSKPLPEEEYIEFLKEHNQ